LVGVLPTRRLLTTDLEKPLADIMINHVIAIPHIATVLVVAMIVWAWRGEPMPALVIGSGIMCSMGAACLVGLSVPALLHAFRPVPKIAAGPLTLAITDALTLLFYFKLATVLL